MSEAEYHFFVGVDWGSETHVVCVLDRERRRLVERSVAHTGLALNDLANELMTLAPSEPGLIAVAIEVPRGAVVDTLLERGIHVFSLNPKQLDRTGTPSPGPRMTGAMPSCLPTPCEPIARPSGASSPITPAWWSCASYHGSRMTWGRSFGV